jgi:hypothetical protein
MLPYFTAHYFLFWNCQYLSSICCVNITQHIGLKWFIQKKEETSADLKKIGKVYFLECTDIPKVFFTQHRVGLCGTNVIWGHCCTLGHSCTDVIQGHCYATVYSNSDPSSHYCTAVGTKGFHCCTTMTPSHAGCCPHRTNVTDRHGWAHKVFFTPARVWRTPKNWTFQKKGNSPIKRVMLVGHFCSEFLSYTNRLMMSFLLYWSDACHGLKQFVNIIDMPPYYWQNISSTACKGLEGTITFTRRSLHQVLSSS